MDRDQSNSRGGSREPGAELLFQGYTPPGPQNGLGLQSGAVSIQDIPGTDDGAGNSEPVMGPPVQGHALPDCQNGPMLVTNGDSNQGARGGEPIPRLPPLAAIAATAGGMGVSDDNRPPTLISLPQSLPSHSTSTILVDGNSGGPGSDDLGRGSREPFPPSGRPDGRQRHFQTPCTFSEYGRRESNMAQTSSHGENMGAPLADWWSLRTKHTWSCQLPSIEESRRIEWEDGKRRLVQGATKPLGPPMKPFDDAKSEMIAQELWRCMVREREIHEARELMRL